MGPLASESREQRRGLTGGSSPAARSSAKPLCSPRSPAHDPALDLLSTGPEHGWWRAWRLGRARGDASRRRLPLDLNCPVGEHPYTSPNLTHARREGGWPEIVWPRAGRGQGGRRRGAVRAASVPVSTAVALLQNLDMTFSDSRPYENTCKEKARKARRTWPR
jgi:hypothetical protein